MLSTRRISIRQAIVEFSTRLISSVDHSQATLNSLLCRRSAAEPGRPDGLDHARGQQHEDEEQRRHQRRTQADAQMPPQLPPGIRAGQQGQHAQPQMDGEGVPAQVARIGHGAQDGHHRQPDAQRRAPGQARPVDGGSRRRAAGAKAVTAQTSEPR